MMVISRSMEERAKPLQPELILILLISIFCLVIQVNPSLTTSYSESACPGSQTFSCEVVGRDFIWVIVYNTSEGIRESAFSLNPSTDVSQPLTRGAITSILTFSFDETTGNSTSTLSTVVDTLDGAVVRCGSLTVNFGSVIIHIASTPTSLVNIRSVNRQSSINSVDMTIGWSPPTNNGGADIVNYTVNISPPTQLSATVVTSTTVTVTADYNEDYTIAIVATNCAGNSTTVEYMFTVDGCLILPNPLNGAFGPVTSRTVGATVSFQCDPGFVSTGAMVGMVTCVNSGTVMWDPDPGTFMCSPFPSTEQPESTAPPADCGTPNPPVNGSIVGPITDTSEGVMIFYRCNSGSFLSGDQPSVCGSDGLWRPDPREQTCTSEPFYCFLPDPPTNGFIVQVSKSTILFGCNDGYMPQMNVTANCIAMNQWSSDPGQYQCVLTERTAPPVSIAPLSTGAAVGITAVVTFIVSVFIGFLAGLLVMYMMVRNKLHKENNSQLSTLTNPPPQEQPPPPGPVYEEVSTPKENIELETNLAYGPVRH